MFEITVHASPLPRTRFSTNREANVRTGDIFTIESQILAGRFLVLIESVVPVQRDGVAASTGELTFLATLGSDDEPLPPPMRPPHFTGDATIVPQSIANRFFGRAPDESDPVTGAVVHPASLEVGNLLANRAVPVVFSGAGFNRHTLMVAQSGSGKSYALGIILEELLARTSLRLAVIDPNGDYAASFSGENVDERFGGLSIASSRDPSRYDALLTPAHGVGRGSVFDLNALDRPLWLPTVHALLHSLWQGRHERRPTVIVLDEAHNFIADTPAVSTVTELVLRIASEGRKFGLWLILASQRAQKLHADVISQCDNLILMRMTNNNDLEHVAHGFSAASREMIGLARGFGKGMALAAGRIVRCPTIFRFRKRVTREGGGDIGLDWATRSDPQP